MESPHNKFERLQASHLYCNRCQQPMPVRERLLLILPDGELYDYLCRGCGDSVGSKTERGPVGRFPKRVVRRPS
jgi:hypothetical protein